MPPIETEDIETVLESIHQRPMAVLERGAEWYAIAAPAVGAPRVAYRLDKTRMTVLAVWLTSPGPPRGAEDLWSVLGLLWNELGCTVRYRHWNGATSIIVTRGEFEESLRAPDPEDLWPQLRTLAERLVERDRSQGAEE